jgi:triacylglycerol esterase/lipase EstA (alpha/beta hydrolase family)
MAFHQPTSQNRLEKHHVGLPTDPQMQEISASGLSSSNLNSVKNHDTKIMVSNKRTFKPKDETEREALGKNQVQSKDFRYFNRRENAWNDLRHMSPKLLKYSSHNVDPVRTFKKTLRDLKQLKEDELHDKKNKHFEFVQQARNQTLDRLSSRKLERFITQYQCS